MRQMQRLLLVEDHEPLRVALKRGFSLRRVEVLEASTVAEAARMLDPVPDAVITDVRLPDGSALEVAKAVMQCRPVPLVVAISGEASAEEAFRLAQAGVRGYLSKPLTAEDLWTLLQETSRRAPPLEPLEPLIAACVGHTDIRNVEGRVRQAMLDQALALTGGNYTEAARLLKVTRQAVARQARGRSGPSD